jgi:hypothetical protein
MQNMAPTLLHWSRLRARRIGPLLPTSASTGLALDLGSPCPESEHQNRLVGIPAQVLPGSRKTSVSAGQICIIQQNLAEFPVGQVAEERVLQNHQTGQMVPATIPKSSKEEEVALPEQPIKWQNTDRFSSGQLAGEATLADQLPGWLDETGHSARQLEGGCTPIKQLAAAEAFSWQLAEDSSPSKQLPGHLAEAAFSEGPLEREAAPTEQLAGHLAGQLAGQLTEELSMPQSQSNIYTLSGKSVNGNKGNICIELLLEELPSRHWNEESDSPVMTSPKDIGTITPAFSKTHHDSKTSPNQFNLHTCHSELSSSLAQDNLKPLALTGNYQEGCNQINCTSQRRPTTSSSQPSRSRNLNWRPGSGGRVSHLATTVSPTTEMKTKTFDESFADNFHARYRRTLQRKETESCLSWDFLPGVPMYELHDL